MRFAIDTLDLILETGRGIAGSFHLLSCLLGPLGRRAVAV
jgi:hypothetical protein